MVSVTRFIGLALIAIGVIAYVASGAESPTALAPAVVGVLLFVLGVLAGRTEHNGTFIHAALAVSLLGVLGSFMPLRDFPAWVSGDDVDRPYAVVTAGLMALLCLAHLVLGVRSFRQARRNIRG